MKVLNIISEKLQQMLGEHYVVLPLANFNRNYTEAREYIEGDNVSYFRYYNSDYGKFRKDKIVGVISFINPTRSNVKGYYLSTTYKIDFSVPRNIVKTNKYNEEIEEQKFNFEDDIEQVINDVINQKVQFADDLWCKLTMSDPVYISSENDGEFEYDIMQVTGTLVASDNATFGSEYKVEILIDDEYVEIDDINSFTEVLSTQNNAIIKHDKTKVEQNLAQSNWGCVIVIDDFMSDNLARKKLYDIIHLNKEIINENETSEALKRKLRVRVTTNNGGVRVFNAIVEITFTSAKNGVGNYAITFTDDNKPIPNYTLAFDSNGGNEVESKEVVHYDIIGELPVPVKEGYHYTGWSIDGEPINENSIYTYSENKVATTNWVANKYYVEFHANNGTGTIYMQEFTYDVENALRANTFVKDGCNFIGWSKEEQGFVDISNNETILNLTTKDNEIIKLYAVWENTIVTAPTIKYKEIGHGYVTIQFSALDDIYYYLSESTEEYPPVVYPMPTGVYYDDRDTLVYHEESNKKYYTLQVVARNNGYESEMRAIRFFTDYRLKTPNISVETKDGIYGKNSIRVITIIPENPKDEIYYTINQSKIDYPGKPGVSGVWPPNYILYTEPFEIENKTGDLIYYKVNGYPARDDNHSFAISGAVYFKILPDGETDNDIGGNS